MHFMIWRPLPASRSSMPSRVTSAHGVGAAGKPQVCWTENAWFVELVSHVQQFKVCRNQFSPISTNRLQYIQMLRSRDLAIFVTMTIDRQTKPIALNLAHVHRVIRLHVTVWAKQPSFTFMPWDSYDRNAFDLGTTGNTRYFFRRRTSVRGRKFLQLRQSMHGLIVKSIKCSGLFFGVCLM